MLIREVLETVIEDDCIYQREVIHNAATGEKREWWVWYPASCNIIFYKEAS